MILTIATINAPAAIGPYSQAKAYNGVLYISGQIPVDPATGALAGDNISEQTEQSCQNVGEILKAAGLGFKDVIKTTCFLIDMSDFVAFNEVYARYFTDRPERSCVAVKALPKNALVEIEAIAAMVM